MLKFLQVHANVHNGELLVFGKDLLVFLPERQSLLKCNSSIIFLLWEKQCWWLWILVINWIVLDVHVHVLGVEKGENVRVTIDWFTHELC